MAPAFHSVLGSVSTSLIPSFQRRISFGSTSHSYHELHKYCSSNGGRVKFNCLSLSYSVLNHAVDDFFEDELRGKQFGYNNSITNVFKLGNQKDGFHFLYTMEERGVSADHKTYLWLLEGSLKNGSLRNARKLHGRIIKAGFEHELTLENQLIHVYKSVGEENEARKLFNGMTDRDVTSWNSIITGYVTDKLNAQALKLFSRMISEAIRPNGSIFSSVLRACNGAKSLNFITQVHAKAIRMGFEADPMVGNPLIDLYAKIGDFHSARVIFDEIFWRDSVSWVAMISGYSQNGHSQEALLLFSHMLGSGVFPTPYIFSSVISACTKIEFFEQGEQLHGYVLKLGFCSETFVGNALVSLYLRCGNVPSAERMFGEMHCKDGITWNSIISGHAQSGNSEKALQYFKEMQFSGFKPDCVTSASLLSACATLGELQKGQKLHSLVIKSGHLTDIIVEGSLLDFYVKCGEIKDAHQHFEATDRGNIVLWNVMLVAYGQLGNLTESLKLFQDMQLREVFPNQYTYPSILRTCTLLGVIDLGEQIHTHIIKMGFELNVHVCSVLIDMYAKCGRLKEARMILERLEEPDLVSWTAMIAGYGQQDCDLMALELFEEMQAQGIESDNIGFASALSACAGLQAIKQGQQIHARSIVCGYFSDISIGNSLITLYAKMGLIEEAYKAFGCIGNRDEISWNALISGFGQFGQFEEAMKVFGQMRRSGFKPNLFTYCSSVSVCANMTDLKQGKQIHTEIIKTGYESETETQNVLVTLYAKCGSIEEARRVFWETPQKNEVSWNAIITGLSQHGFGRDALKLFREMKKQGLKPTHVTFVSVLSACSHVGLVREGLSYFESMAKDHNISPRPEHYACVVDLLGRAGLLLEAKRFIDNMPIEPDAMVWKTFLSACTVHKNLELGEAAAKSLLELDSHDSAAYVLLSNAYAKRGRWDERDKIRLLMREKGVRKEPGQSWIEVAHSVSSFFVGDRLHPQADEIYEKLKDLNSLVEEIGYIPEKNSLLQDVERESKDPDTLVHSEKLAVSFGLMGLAPLVPVRVIKNLRVCNDCHNWMKFVSRVSGRAVIVRDANRFHHFEGGVCSCGDYW
ncbi:hypothetical protein AMTRI_Chr03g149040 [Amborella trichopoda]